MKDKYILAFKVYVDSFGNYKIVYGKSKSLAKPKKRLVKDFKEDI